MTSPSLQNRCLLPRMIEPVIDNWLDAGWADRELRADVSVGLSSHPRSCRPNGSMTTAAAISSIRSHAWRSTTQRGANREILEREADAIVESSGADCLVELGSGTSEKTRILLNAFASAKQLRRYIPFDNSEATLRNAALDWPRPTRGCGSMG